MRISHDTCRPVHECAREVISVERAIAMQSLQVNVGDFLKQLRQVCGIQPPQIAIGGPQTILANDSDKITVSGGTTTSSTATSKATSKATVSTPRPTKATSDPVYSYKVKIINPNKKSDVAVFYLNDFGGAFDSVTSLRVKLIETFRE